MPVSPCSPGLDAIEHLIRSDRIAGLHPTRLRAQMSGASISTLVDCARLYFRKLIVPRRPNLAEFRLFLDDVR